MKIEEKIIDYKLNEEDIIHWTNLKGDFRYFEIISFLESKDIECTWKNVTYYIKYDKRLLINSFKYLVFLEELFKSFINKYQTPKKSELINYTFDRTLEHFLELGNLCNYDAMDIDLLSRERKTLNVYRNSVVHNKVLLNRVFNGNSIEQVLNIIMKILPKSYRDGFINDINSSFNNMPKKLWNINIKIEEDKKE